MTVPCSGRLVFRSNHCVGTAQFYVKSKDYILLKSVLLAIKGSSVGLVNMTRRNRRSNWNFITSIRTAYGKYKRKSARGGMRCTILRRECLHQNHNVCEGCLVLCKRKVKTISRKCEKCASRFMCLTGAFSP